MLIIRFKLLQQSIFIFFQCQSILLLTKDLGHLRFELFLFHIFLNNIVY